MEKAKKLVSLFITFCMLSVFVPMPMAYADNQFSGGNGTENDPYLITSADDFKQLATEVNGGNNYIDTYFKIPETVTETIELSTEDGYVPIGKTKTGDNTKIAPFNGNFDGGNHTIKLNLSGTDGLGLFGYCGSYSVVQNIKTTGSIDASEGSSYAGGIAAQAQGDIINCHNAVSIKGPTEYTGGIAGYINSDRYILNCSNSGEIVGSNYVGGIVGKGFGYINLVNCLNTGDVSGKQQTGGIVGEIGEYNVSISNCVNNGKVIKLEKAVGGILGNKGSEKATIENCYYNSSKNADVYDFGYFNDETEITTTNFAKTSEEIISTDVVYSLNLYARDNTPNETKLLYWEVNDGEITFTDVEPGWQYTITNDSSKYITVKQSAFANESVEINADKVPDYLKIKKVTVNNNEIKANSQGKYVFTMPEQNVTIAAEVEVNLEKNSNNEYIISTDEELAILSKAVNDGFETRNVVLTADVTASTANGFEPIGTNDNPYKGDFNGKGHTITLDITSGTEYNDTVATGLFGVTYNAYIRNLVIKGSVDGGADTSSYTGALIGVMDSASDLYNVYSEVSVSGSGFVGGFIGYGMINANLYNVVNNGTVVQKNTADDKKSVGAFVSIGNCHYYTSYYNSDKNSGVFYAGYDNDENKVTVDNLDTAKTTEELFSDSTMDSLNIRSQYRGEMYWDFVTENEIQTAKIVEKCPVPVYEIYNTYDDDIIQNSADHSRAGKTIEVEVDLYNADSNLINSVKEIRVTDSKGKSVKVTKTGNDKYEFVMPKSDVYIEAICDYNLTTDSEGVYYISDIDDLAIFARIVEAGQTDANAKVVAKSLNYRDYSGYWNYSDKELIGRNAPYTGTFDGNGAEITLNCILFAETDGAVIKNVNIDTDVYNDKSAGIVKIANNTRIDNCDIYIKLNYGSIGGGIAAEAYNSTITNCCVTANGYVVDFGGIVYSTTGNTVIANCVLKNSSVRVMSLYGGIVCEAYGKTEIYNCANDDLFNPGGSGGIVECAEMSGLTLENNMYRKENDCYDVCYDLEKDIYISAMVDKDSAVSEEDADGLYIPAKLNEYVRANPNRVEGITLKKWSIDYNDEPCFANNKNPEVYLIKQSGIKADTLIDGNYARGAFAGEKVTVDGVADGATVAVTDVNGNDIKLTKNENDYEFTMPECDVTVSVVLDTGISETTVIDGKTYVVVKTASDFIKAVKSIAVGNSELNVYIAENINLTAEDLAEYPTYNDEMKSYNGIFDGVGHTVTFDGLKQAMLCAIGSEGIVKNITVDGTISSIKSDNSEEVSETEAMASGIAMTNAGQIVNCINKADINGIVASGITIFNNGTVFNCMNKGDITGLKLAGAITGLNRSDVIIASNEGTITNQNESSSGNSMTGNGNSGIFAEDFSTETNNSSKTEFAATANAISESIQATDNSGFKLSESALQWSVSKTETSEELVFADDENTPYYLFFYNGVQQPYKAGETVEFTVDTSNFEEDLVISDITLEGQNDKLNIKISPVEGKEDTFTFTMPNEFCRIVVKTEVKGVEKDEDGYYLVGTLDDLNKVKQTIELGNYDINVKLTNDIAEYDGTPIGVLGGYNGTFDGNGHSITVAMNDESNSYQHYGLFEALGTDAVVKNLTINGSIKTNADYVGAFAGLCDGMITNCVNNATVTNESKYDDGATGGFIGQNLSQTSSTLISNCVNNGEINGYNVGGIVGYSESYKYNPAKITDCVNNGKLNAENYVGGIITVGWYSKVTNCVNNADINANYGAGGIIGFVWDSKVEIINCANNGNVVSKEEIAAGIGMTDGAITVKNCLNSGNVSGSLGSYGIVYYTNYYGDSTNDVMILNSFYLQTADVNNEIESSNVVIKNDLSKAVSESDISSGYVAAMLNNGVTDGLKYWDVKNDKVVFADDESELCYAIEISKNITGGTVTADKQFAKAGETVTLTVTPETEGKSAIITGVELDENNSFVMPDRGVKINAVFGDTFIGTEKSDIIELDENVEMDEIKLADYVKFENDAISRDFTFTLADGNVLPDGLKLSYARISGTPKKAGTYTVVFDVTDNGADMISTMALEPNKALGNAQLTLTFKITKTDEIEPIGKYKDKIDIKEKITDENVVFTITPTDGSIDEIATSKLYVAEYDSEGKLIGIKLGENQNVDGKLIITAESPKTDNYKLMLWDKTNYPMINAISDIH